MAQAATITGSPAYEAPARLRTQPITPLPDRIAVGRGTAVFLDGSCFSPGSSIRAITLLLDEVEHPVIAQGQPPPGRLSGSDYWWAIVPIEAVDRPRLARVRLRAKLADETEATADIGAIELCREVEAPEPPRPAALDAPRDVAEPLIAICMATFEPPLDLFERQVESIRSQSHSSWICVISDDCSAPETLEAMRAVLGGDERFVVFPSPERLGVYRNFERALALVPSEAAYVALSDQDDRWYPRKLETLRRDLEGGAKLAYSDMRIVDRDGTVISDTYWSYRRNNHTNLGSLLVANTITGAASLFTRDILEYALPLPPRLGNNYHDHWIALVAMALGRVGYVDAPLYDYVQHGEAALGHARANAAHRRGGTRQERISRLRKRLAKLRRVGYHFGWRYLYFGLWCPIALTARVAEVRCGAVMTTRKRRTLGWFNDSKRGMAWLAARSARPFVGATETLGRERLLLAALAWRRLVAWRTRAQAIKRVHSAGSSDGLVPRGGGLPASVRPGAMGVSANGSGSEWLTPILVDYFTRDGSTLMMRLLASSPQIAVEEAYPYERKYFSYLWRWSRVLERGEWPEEAWGPRAFGSLTQERTTPVVGPLPWRPRDLIESGAEEESMSERCFELAWAEFSRRAARWTRAQPGNEAADVRYYAEKHLNTWMIDPAELPPVKVVVLLRDPRDTYVSIDAFDQTKRATMAGNRDRLYQVIERQRHRLRWIAGLLESGDSPVVRYEELVRDLPAVAAQLQAWLGVELQPEAVAGDKVLRRRHMTAKSPEESIGRWREELDPEVAETMTRELGPELTAVGIEV